jgi:uncharacterized protein YeeX (DUF496 family)
MPLDVDYIVANDAIEELKKILSDTPHGEREDIADDIIEMVEILKQKYNIKSS